MARILISPDEVDQVANTFKQSGDQTQQLVAALNQQVQSMQGQWEGMTQQRFFQQFQDAYKNMQASVQLMEQISQELHSIANRFRQVDQAQL